MKTIRETYNDGFLLYGRMTTARTEKGRRVGETFESEGKLAFNTLSSREEDYRMADFMSASLDLKVKTPLPPGAKDFTRRRVVLDGFYYDVIKADPDKARGQLYLYLQEVGEHGQD